MLKLLVASGIRDKILHINNLLDGAPLALTEQLDWALNSHAMLLCISEFLTENDLHTFISHQLITIAAGLLCLPVLAARSMALPF